MPIYLDSYSTGVGCVTFVTFGSVYTVRTTHTGLVLVYWNAVFCDRMYRRTSVRKYASEIAVSSIGSEPSERSRKGRRLRGNGTLSAVSHWKSFGG